MKGFTGCLAKRNGWEAGHPAQLSQALDMGRLARISPWSLQSLASPEEGLVSACLLILSAGRQTSVFMRNALYADRTVTKAERKNKDCGSKLSARHAVSQWFAVCDLCVMSHQGS